MKSLYFFLFLLIGTTVSAQVDTAAVQRLYYRAMHLTITDSVKYYADYVDHLSVTAGNPGMRIESLRMYGWYL